MLESAWLLPWDGWWNPARNDRVELAGESTTRGRVKQCVAAPPFARPVFGSRLLEPDDLELGASIERIARPIVLYPWRPRGHTPWMWCMDVVDLGGRTALHLVDQLLPSSPSHERALPIQQRIETRVRDPASIGGHAAAVEAVEVAVHLGEER